MLTMHPALVQGAREHTLQEGRRDGKPILGAIKD